VAKVPINPEVLKWARKERNLSVEEAAAKIGIDPAHLRAYETEATSLGLGLLRDIAAAYEIPDYSLTMPAPLPPPAGEPEDYRTFEGKPAALSFDSKLAVRDVQMRVYLWTELDREIPDLLGREHLPTVTLADDPDRIAASERLRIGVNSRVQLSWTTAEDAFKRWRLKVEDQGPFVYLERFPPADCRGFSLVRGNALAIVVNEHENEWVEGAKIFTLFHEYAHVLLRRGGICLEQTQHQVERFCNRFASAFLLPDRLLSALEDMVGSDWTDANLRAAAKASKVSVSALALRLEYVDRLARGTYDRLRNEWASRPSMPPRPKGRPRVTWAQRRLKRLGSRHVSLTLSSLETHRVSPVDAYDLLELGPRHYDEFRERLRALRRNYAV
jgi:Zn-dependent peptidase ImmA (M78 family)